MKIVIITFSNTGNTQMMGKIIGEELCREGEHEVVKVDGFSLIKYFGVGGRTGSKIKSFEDIDNSKKIKDMIETIKSAEVLGVGSYVYGFFPPPGVTELFDEVVLPKTLFQKMQFFFVFSSHGSLKSPTCTILRETIQTKNPSAIFCGSIDLHCPETAVELMAPLGHPDEWSTKEIERLREFGKTLLVSLTKKEKKTGKTIIPMKAYKVAQSTSQNIIRDITGKLSISEDLCIGCMKCVNVCPWNAMEKKVKNVKKAPSESEKGIENKEQMESHAIKIKDIEEYVPMCNDKECWHCARCYNLCPKKAISFPRFNTQLRVQHSAPKLPSSYNKSENQSELSESSSATKQSASSSSNDLPKFVSLAHRMFIGHRGIEGFLVILLCFTILLILKKLL
ncbi:uncharacterized protein MONOS_2176 [Monocercomonoides exilis]|uniref:uncharacterized protein n=1 Tax=Monocercomonoides exilis TaxID=2049356 RepID=UPI00355AC6C0|nr:hypothetical protein MONOS_2176 [Monocercomonoides exilis]|eukprot:MONOS_2176.1-p1 / transcript=MONOS_2176.1 / gene=MONOS_2176 / organism=Monocercomonoides_exilis_PA203 / gene_product=unspecified product / transcript_product=unspecified product / location=Mono_scaffold00043:65324-66505(+) / protein_length=393 / sequence_SO=supercontig / SO=protein_coding / is_pseudo=false